MENPKDNPEKRQFILWISSSFLGVLLGGLILLGILNVFDEKEPVQSTKVSASETSSSDSSAQDITQLIDRVDEAVVSVVNKQASKEQPFLEGETSLQKAGTGSGFVYKKENGNAYVATNHHVVEGAEKIEVNLPGGKTEEATLLGSDPLLDLAVLRIDSDNVKETVKLGDSSNLQIGQTAIAVGNPLGFLEGSVTKGIISNVNESMPVDINKDKQPDWEARVLQTDASINPGNSGGPLLNANGEVIGINSSKIAQTSVEGIGFAIPSNVALPIIEQLEKKGQVDRPYLGISLINVAEFQHAQLEQRINLPADVKNGIIIREVANNGPADKAGLKAKDVIVSIDEQNISSSVDLREYLYRQTKSGEKVKVTYYRNGSKETTSLTLQTKDLFTTE
jgi:serine protease Do